MLCWIPLSLNLKEFIDKNLCFDKQSKYNLYSVFNGVVNLGHHNSFIKLDKNNSWYCFDDSTVNLIGNDLNNKRNAYILVYMQDNTLCWIIYFIYNKK